MPQDTPRRDSSTDIATLKRLARDLTRSQSYPEALALWQEIERDRGESAESRLAIARLYAKQGDWGNARAASSAGLGVGSAKHRAPLLKIHGQASIELGDYPTAVQAYGSAAAVAPEATVAAARRLMARKQHEFAGHLLATVLLDHPDHDPALSLKPELMAILDEMRREPSRTPQEKAEICRIILVIDSGFRSAHKQLRELRNNALQQARAAVDAGDLDTAEQAFNNALGCNPQDPAALRGLANIDKERGDWDSLAHRWERISLAENHPERVVLAHAKALEKAGRDTEALQVLQRLTQESRTGSAARTLLIRLSNRVLQSAKNQLANGEIIASLSTTTSVRRLLPDHPKAERYEKLSYAQGRRQVQAYAQQANHAAVITHAQALLDFSADDLSLLRHLCQSYAKLRLHKEGIPWFRRLAELEPDQASHWLRYAISCHVTRNEDEALEAARHVIALDPSNGSATRLIEAILQRRLQQQAVETASSQQKP